MYGWNIWDTHVSFIQPVWVGNTTRWFQVTFYLWKRQMCLLFTKPLKGSLWNETTSIGIPIKTFVDIGDSKWLFDPYFVLCCVCFCTIFWGACEETHLSSEKRAHKPAWFFSTMKCHQSTSNIHSLWKHHERTRVFQVTCDLFKGCWWPLTRE